MKNILNYVADTSWLLFHDKPLCEADSLVFSQIAYLDFSDSVATPNRLGSAIRLRDAILLSGIRPLGKSTLAPEKNEALLHTLLTSKRFADIELRAYINEVDPVAEKQFSAITFCLPDDQAYVAFRGTDTNIVGWKEDLNMAFTYPVPAQESALAYLNKVEGHLKGDIFVGGHSKGGNLAIYAAVKSSPEVQDRIKGVFNHDGPGFKEEIYSEASYLSLESRIHVSLPTHSVVGILLQHDDNYKVVRSSSIGLLQHDPFTWGIKDLDLYFTGGLDRQSVLIDRTVNSFLKSLDDEQRRRFVDTLFEVLGTSDLTTLQEVRRNWRKVLSGSLDAISKTDDETRKFALEIAKVFIASARENLRKDFEERLDQGRMMVRRAAKPKNGKPGPTPNGGSIG